jgi:hypothetical protein
MVLEIVHIMNFFPAVADQGSRCAGGPLARGKRNDR